MDFPLSFHYVSLFLTQIGPLTGSPEPEASGCLPYTHVGNHITAFHQEYCERSSPHACGRWETGCRGRTGGRKKTQYCLPYTRRGKQLWQPVCPFLRFLPYTYGEAPTLMTRPSPAMSSSLRVTGESPRRPATPRTESWSSLHIWGSPPSRPVPHAPDATFRKAGSLSACTACALMLRAGMDGLSCRRVFPGPFFALFLARDSDAQ